MSSPAPTNPPVAGGRTRWDERDVPPPEEIVPAAKEALRRRWSRITYVGRRRARAGDRHRLTVARVCGWLLVIVVGVAGTVAVVGDASTVLEARRLAEDGRPARVIGAQVHVVDRDTTSGVARRTIDGVHVTFDGGPGYGVVLQGVRSREVEGAHGQEGWGAPTTETGYRDPFAIHYLKQDDGQFLAMADSDLAYWAAGGPIWWQAFVVLLLVMGATGAGCWRRLSVPQQRTPRIPTRSEPPSTP